MALTAASGSAATRIAVTSGKGGVGKTTLSVNLAVATSRLGHQVGLVDADFALGNVDVVLGLAPDHHLGSVLVGARSVSEIVIDGPSGIRVLPAGSGVRSLTTLDDAKWTRLSQAMDEAGRSLDFLFFDTATGISDNVLDVVGLSDYVLVVTTFEPSAVVDAYAVIKLVTATAPGKPIGLVVNSARDAEEAHVVFRQISTAAERFLHRSIRFDGYVLEDRDIRESILAQVPVLERKSAGPASRCIRRLAARLASLRPSSIGPWAARPSVPVAGGSSLEAPCA